MAPDFRLGSWLQVPRSMNLEMLVDNDMVFIRNDDGYRAHLTVSRVGDTPYLDRGWVERG